MEMPTAVINSLRPYRDTAVAVMGLPRRGGLALACLAAACLCGRAASPDAHAAAATTVQQVEISVRARAGDEWAAVLPDGLLSLRVPGPARGDLSADLDAFLSLSEAHSDVAAKTGPGVGAPQVTVAVDAVDVASCSLPCSVRLENVASGEHAVTAAGTGPWRGLAVRPCRFRLAGLDEVGGLGGAKGGEDSARDARGMEPAVSQRAHEAGPGTRSADGRERESRGEHQPALNADGRYVAILFPADDTCLTDGRNAYVSVTVTDGFFKLPRTHDILARFETTVHCIIENDMAVPAPLDYDPKAQGPLVQCHSYESDFTLTDGYVRKLDGSLAGVPGMGQHDCPPGTVCKHDLEDGFMIDVWLVVPEAGQTIQSDLAAGMHVSRFFLIDAHTRQQMGREATVTFFVDHGTGRVCRPVPSAVSLPSSQALDASGHDAPSLSFPSSVPSKGAPNVHDVHHIPASERAAEPRQQQQQQKRRRLVNVARKGRAVQSSTVDGADAALAIDGSTAVGGVPGDRGSWEKGRPMGRSSRTLHEPSPFWEVELEFPAEVRCGLLSTSVPVRRSACMLCAQAYPLRSLPRGAALRWVECAGHMCTHARAHSLAHISAVGEHYHLGRSAQHRFQRVSGVSSCHASSSRSRLPARSAMHVDIS